jgi:hypothetical protein
MPNPLVIMPHNSNLSVISSSQASVTEEHFPSIAELGLEESDKSPSVSFKKEKAIKISNFSKDTPGKKEQESDSYEEGSSERSSNK